MKRTHRRLAPPGTVRPLVVGGVVFASGLTLAVLLTPRADFYLLAAIVVALAALSRWGIATGRARGWAILFLVGALLGTLGSLGHRYARRHPGDVRPGDGTAAWWMEPA